MATIDIASLSKAPSVPVHFLPCTIEHDGPAKVSTYFVIRPEHDLPADRTPVPRKPTASNADVLDGEISGKGKGNAVETEEQIDEAGNEQDARNEDEEAMGSSSVVTLRKSESAIFGVETQDSGYASVVEQSPRLDGEQDDGVVMDSGARRTTEMPAVDSETYACWYLVVMVNIASKNQALTA